MFDQFENFFNSIDPLLAYVLLFISAFVENTFPPIPGDTVTILGAYLITAGHLTFWGVYISTTTGSVLGFFTMYMIGILSGPAFFKTGKRSKIFNERQIKKVEIWFANYGYWVILANRFLSGTRSVISLFAGFFHLKWFFVLILSALSAMIWNGALIYGGYLLGTKLELIKEIITQYNRVVLIIMVILVAALLFWRASRKKKKIKLTDKEL